MIALLLLHIQNNDCKIVNLLPRLHGLRNMLLNCSLTKAFLILMPSSHVNLIRKALQMYKKVLELKKVTQDLLLFAILLWRSKAYQISSLTRLTRADHKICCLCFCCFHFLQINVCDLFSSSIPFILSSWAEIH